ncbi:hypothetical protein GHK45_23370 [Sinorhizobium meliloti]|uniref:HNH endonuclease n=1 Tax=Rhizobium meliloti TaxID=382 RepID=A0A6A7ZUK9_RHIML|nr:SEC-C metal-binding domain-containing protein [Sinorhizobium meliloti]MQW06556.1 hypothetical protein [Sinorhizobium meliloti]
MANENKYGLKRSDLTSEQKRQIRKNAGFGCVICGNAIGEYEHIDPEFHEAREHDVSKMAFLCIGCHGKVTRKIISKDSVKRAAKHPAALKKGFSFDAFDVSSDEPVLHFGPLSAVGCTYLIRVGERPVLWIKEPEEEGGPFRLNAEMRNKDGLLILSIIDNEWRANIDSWDVETVGPRIKIRNAKGDVALIIKSEPPRTLKIEKLDMRMEGFRFQCDGDRFTIETPTGDVLEAYESEVGNCLDAILVDESGLVIGSGRSGKGTNYMKMKSLSFNAKPPAVREPVGRRNAACRCGSGRRYKHCCGQFPLY